MDEKRGLYIGIDLADDFTQLVYSKGRNELYSVSLSADQTKFRIPTVLYPGGKGRPWLIGEDAIKADEERHEQGSMLITGILEAVVEGRNIVTGDREFRATDILATFLDKLLHTLYTRTETESVLYLTITMKAHDAVLEEGIKQALSKLHIGLDKLQIQTYPESFMYFVMSQNKDIWINDVALFDFDSTGFIFYRLMFGRKQYPITIVAEKTDLTESFNYEMLKTYKSDALLYAFENVTNMMLNKQLVSSIYFTGAGFENSWADEVLKGLCNGRRVFRGQNLFVKGACYASTVVYEGRENDYLMVGDDCMKSSISIRAVKDGNIEELPLVRIGEPYLTAGKTMEVILDDTNELDFIVHNVLKKDFLCAIMTLEAIEERTDRSVRVSINVRLKDRNTCIITVRDVGFGEIYKSNHRIWEQVLSV